MLCTLAIPLCMPRPDRTPHAPPQLTQKQSQVEMLLLDELTQFLSRFVRHIGERLRVWLFVHATPFLRSITFHALTHRLTHSRRSLCVVLRKRGHLVAIRKTRKLAVTGRDGAGSRHGRI